MAKIIDWLAHSAAATGAHASLLTAQPATAFHKLTHQQPSAEPDSAVIFRKKNPKKHTTEKTDPENPDSGKSNSENTKSHSDSGEEQTETRQRRDRSSQRLDGWIGVDLDSTLAFFDGWKGHQHIGEPIPDMLKRVKRWVAMGIEVRIFTARASHPEHIAPVEAWLANHGLKGLQVTNQKDYRMLQLWDDRCIQVVANTGELFKNADWVDKRALLLASSEAATADESGATTEPSSKEIPSSETVAEISPKDPPPGNA